MGKKLKQYLSKGFSLGKNIAKIGAKVATKAAKLGFGAAKIGAKAAKIGGKIGYKAVKKGIQGGIKGGKMGYQGAKKAYEIAKQLAPHVKQKITKGANAISTKMENASRAFKRLIHSQQLLTIGKIIDSKKSDSYKTYLIRKYIEGLKRGQEVPIEIVDQIQQSLLDKVIESHLPVPIKMTESFMIDPQQNQAMKDTNTSMRRSSRRR